jgi:uncharacterized membrane protein
MKKVVLITCLIGLGLVILIKSGVIGSLVVFLLIGAVPGTDYTIPASGMLLVIMSILWLLIFRFTAIELFYTFISKRSVRPKMTHKKRLPRRRFGQI